MSATMSTPGPGSMSELIQPNGVIGPQPQCRRRSMSRNSLTQERLHIAVDKRFDIARAGRGQAAIGSQSAKRPEIIQAAQLALMRFDGGHLDIEGDIDR